MNIDDIAKAAQITDRHLFYLLSGQRMASTRTAYKLEMVTGISKETWVFGTAQERRAAWEKFKAQVSKRPETQEGEP